MLSMQRCCLLALSPLALAALEPAARAHPDLTGLFGAVTVAWNAEEQRAAAQAPELRGRWLTVRATAYSPHDAVDGSYHASKGERWRWITADGRTDVRTIPYGIAVPRLAGSRPAWPYGTRVLIPAGQGYLDRSLPEDRIFTVDDSGGAIRGKTERSGVLHIDLRFRSEASARDFAGERGWREIRVMVLE
ncbi:MAG TPA: hypothetical protein DCS97_11490 [Planctomycetes bacterium]|nr:hypothetical protein [Planctomycetota bacterium]